MRNTIRPVIRPLIAAIVVTIAAVGVLVFGPAQQADAATGGVRDGTSSMVTKAEWNRIDPRDTRSEVNRILDGDGRYWWSTSDGDYYFLYRAAWGSNQALVVWYDTTTYGDGFRVWDNFRSNNPYLNWTRAWAR